MVFCKVVLGNVGNSRGRKIRGKKNPLTKDRILLKICLLVKQVMSEKNETV